MKALLSIFQDIEETEAVKEADPQSDVIVCKPDGQSFTILLEAMVRHEDFKVLDQVFEYMQASNIAASPRSLRRLHL
jgi:pentatricopeptide repeat protein